MSVYTKMEETPRTSWTQNISYPPSIVLKLLILQKRDEAIQELRNFQYQDARGIHAKIHRVKARILCLYLELYSALRRSLTPEEFKDLSLKAKSDKIQDLTDAFFIMSDFLDEKRITRFDSRQNYDTTIPEEENLFHGL